MYNQYHVIKHHANNIDESLRITVSAENAQKASEILKQYGYKILATSEEYHMITVAE